MTEKLSHIDETGRIQMVDVGMKPESERIALAKGDVRMRRETLNLIRTGAMKKGDVISAARLAGIMGAKHTAELIPLCHLLVITYIDVDIVMDDELPGLRIAATVKTTGRTGVEMEALTAVSVTALTIYDMAKAVDKTMHIENIRLVEKRGGVSGDIKNL